MAQRDWIEVMEKFKKKAPGYLETFLESEAGFLPSDEQPSPFSDGSGNFSAGALEKPRPGSWIPVYKRSDLPQELHELGLMPVRAGQAEFFFYKGEIFFDLTEQPFAPVDSAAIEPIGHFVPMTLRADFQRNENAYLNKALALGYINHFLSQERLHVLRRTVHNPSGDRLLYGQFGKIKTTRPLLFETSKGRRRLNAGFQFEIDLVLENRDEIIIFEAKCGERPMKSFSLLQLYYPLIYLKSILEEPKPIRTVFMDITAADGSESYRMMEVVFEEGMFDRWRVIQSNEYMTSN
jgi:hypothetical protein